MNSIKDKKCTIFHLDEKMMQCSSYHIVSIFNVKIYQDDLCNFNYNWNEPT